MKQKIDSGKKMTKAAKTIDNCQDTKKSTKLGVKGPTTLKSYRFTGGYD